MGRYIPPDLEGTTSFNTASGKGHALGSRARKLKSSGILIVRFECPFAIWCTNCQPEQIIGQGVRFNAEKKKVGQYYSTAIWSFTFKHTVCGGRIEVRTDPRNAEYVVVEGGRRRDTGEDKLLDGEVRIGVSEEEKERFERDGGMGSLEKKIEDKKAGDAQKRRIDELVTRSERDWADPYGMSRRLRKEFRVGRRQRQADAKSAKALQDRFGLEFELVAPNEEDSERAGFIEFGEAKVDDPASKPMFTEESIISEELRVTDRGKRGKQGVDEGMAQKAALRNSLKGNTRIALDPFLSKDTPAAQNPWRPNVKRTTGLESKEMEKITHVEGVNPSEVPQQVGLVGYASDSS